MAQQTEEKVLKLSMAIMVVFAILGIVFGILLSSEVILFDGIFSIASIGISYLTLLVSRYIRKRDDKKFPFGKARIEPLVVLIQYLILNMLLLYIFIDGIQMILNGGNQLNFSGTIFYLILTTIIVYFFVKKLVKTARQSRSPIVKAEVIQWEISLKQSLFVLAGYLVGLVLLLFNENNVVAYIDPIILIVFVIVSFTQTFREMGTAFKEMIGMSTIGKDTYAQVDDKVHQIAEKYNIKDYFIRLSKVGGMLMLDVDFLVDKEFKYGSVTEQDEIRDAVLRKVNEKHFDLWLSISFTTQYKWID